MKKITATLSVLLAFTGFSQTQFAQVKHLAYGDWLPYAFTAIYPEDMNGDGLKDLIVAGSYDYWHLNLGHGVFSRYRLNPVNIVGPVKDLQMADLNGDGIKDMLIGSLSTNYQLSWCPMNSWGLSMQQVIAAAQTPGISKVRAADLDGDGDNDVLSSAALDDRIAWYANNGTGSFGPQQTITALADSVLWIETADLDADGDIDIVSASAGDNTIAWYENDGSATFTEHLISTATIGAACVNLSDTDGDGDLDLLTASSGDNTIALYENTGSGTFGAQQIISTQATGARCVAASDLDGDGDPDILSASAGNNTIARYENTGGTFGSPQIVDSKCRGALFVTASDLDNDGDNDIIGVAGQGAAYDRGIAHYPNEGNAFPRKKYVYGVAESAKDISAADFDGDNDLDLLFASPDDSQVAWMENISGLFGNVEKMPDSLNGAWAAQPLDVDNDGLPDIVAASKTNDQLLWYHNAGGSVFDPQQAIATLDAPHTIRIADLDGDGYKDVLTGSNAISWYRNLGNGSFQSAQTIAPDAGKVRQCYAADMNGDGLTDIAAGDSTDIYWFLNTGSGTFGAQQDIGSAPDGLKDIFAGDIDNDGDGDIAYVSWTTTSLRWFDNAAGTFTDHLVANNMTYPTFGYFTTVTAADLDGDGDLELIGALDIGSARYYLNNGTGFTPSWAAGFNYFENVGAFSAFAADMNADGDMDVMFAGAQSSGWNGIDFHENLLANADISGRIYVDHNQDGQYGPGDYAIPQTAVLTSPQNAFTFTQPDGSYFVGLGNLPQQFQVFPAPIPNWAITTDSSVYHITMDSSFATLSNLDFGLFPDTLIDSLNVYFGMSASGCNNNSPIWLRVSNYGTTRPSGLIHLELDDSIAFVSAIPAPDSIVGQHIWWHYDSLMYFAHFEIAIIGQMPGFLNMGNLLTSNLTVTIEDSSGTVTFTDQWSAIATCAYDPNHKTVEPAGTGPQGFIPMDSDWLEYTVDFQNTGNGVATDVVLKDQLDANLDWATLQPLAWSDTVQIDVDQYGLATFSFQDIFLPDSTSDETGSHGFIRYRIRLKPGLPASTVIQNTASIFFDQNPAIVTNTVTNTLYTCADSIAYTFPVTATCMNEQLAGHVTLQQPYYTYNWSIAGYTENDAWFNWFPDSSGTFDLALTATHASGLCPVVGTTIPVTVYPTPVSVPDTVTICQGESAVIFGVSHTQTGNYQQNYQSVNGCDSLAIVHLDVRSLPAVHLDAFAQDTICEEDGTVALPVGTPANGTFSGNGVAGSTFDPLLSGTGTHIVTYTYTDSYACTSSDFALILVEDCLGLQESFANSVTLFPNPFSGSFTIRFEEALTSGFDLRIADIAGKTVYAQTELTGKTQVIQLPEISAGVYTVVLTDTYTGRKLTKRLIAK